MKKYIKIKILPTPHNIEFKYVGKLLFDINYMIYSEPGHLIESGWVNSKGHAHRENGPAIIWNDGDQYWCCFDRLLEKNFK